MIKARYYGKRIGDFVYKTFKSRASMLRAKEGLKKKRGIVLKQYKRNLNKSRYYK